MKSMRKGHNNTIQCLILGISLNEYMEDIWENLLLGGTYQLIEPKYFFFVCLSVSRFACALVRANLKNGLTELMEVSTTANLP